MGYMSSYGLLGTPHLISVQDFAFRGRPVSLLVAYAPAGLTYSAFPAGVFALLSNQLLEATKYMKTTFTMPIKTQTKLILHQESRFIVRIFLQLNYFRHSLFFIKAVNLACLLETILSPCAWHTLLLAQALFLLA